MKPGKTWSPVRVDGPDGARRAQVAHRGDPSAVDRDVPRPGRTPGPVHESAAADDEIVALRRQTGRAAAAAPQPGPPPGSKVASARAAWRRAVGKSML